MRLMRGLCALLRGSLPMLKGMIKPGWRCEIIKWFFLVCAYVLSLWSVALVVPVPEISIPFRLLDLSALTVTDWASIATVVALFANVYVIFQAREELKLDRVERKEARIYQAWEGITNPKVPGPRKIEYLEFLHGEGESFQQLELTEGTNLTWRDRVHECSIGIQFVGADLYRVNFEGVKLRNSNFRGARLQWANFQGARLEHANFQDALLEHANFKNALLDEADMRNALEVTDEQIQDAFYCEELPKLPESVKVIPKKITRAEWMQLYNRLGVKPNDDSSVS